MSADVGLVSDHAVSDRGAARSRGLLIAGVAVAAVAAIAYIVALATHPADKLLNGFDLSVYLGGAGQALIEGAEGVHGRRKGARWLQRGNQARRSCKKNARARRAGVKPPFDQMTGADDELR